MTAIIERQSYLAATNDGGGRNSPSARSELPRLPDFLRQAAQFTLVTRLVFTIREPYKSQVCQLAAGQPLRLRRDRDNPHSSQAVCVETLAGCAVGYLSADVASFLAILLDHDPDLADRSTAENVLLAAPPDDPAARRLRYPKLDLCIRLDMADSWPMFVIAIVLGMKTEDFACRFNLAGNPWLQPVVAFHDEYRRLGHDRFHLPEPLAEAWFRLTRDQ
jgi:hypothetical protein